MFSLSDRGPSSDSLAYVRHPLIASSDASEDKALLSYLPGSQFRLTARNRNDRIESGHPLYHALRIVTLFHMHNGHLLRIIGGPPP